MVSPDLATSNIEASSRASRTHNACRHAVRQSPLGEDLGARHWDMFCLLLPTRRAIDASVSEKLLHVSCQTTITGIRPADIKHGNITLVVG